MRIAVLNGSPKGEISVTMQYVAYLAKHKPQHDWQIQHIAQRARKLESSATAFDEVIEAVRAADLVLWAFPLYFALVHGGYKRFIELVFERGAQSAFAGKPAAALSTSIHYYDHTAHNYIHAISDDLAMRYQGFYSADMHDLFDEAKRSQLLQFGRLILEGAERGTALPRRYFPLPAPDWRYTPGPAKAAVAPQNLRVLILHDPFEAENNIEPMVTQLQASFSGPVRVFDIAEKGPVANCIGCLHCAGNFECSFEGKDPYIDFFREEIMQADFLIYVGAMKDRYLSARWKTFFDRSFLNTHTPAMIGKQMAFVVSGPLSQNENLREILMAYAEFQGASLVGIASDETQDAAALDADLLEVARRGVERALLGYHNPETFLGHAGRKVFRDDIWGRLRTVFIADHRAYRRLGYYDFPQRDLRMRFFNLFVPWLVSLPPIREQFNSRIKEGMIDGLKKLVDESQVIEHYPPAAAAGYDPRVDAARMGAD